MKKNKRDAVSDPSIDIGKYDFMREVIKDRPINRKRLLQRTIITVSMAILFGLVACVTFLALEPMLSNWLHPADTVVEDIVLPEEEDEVLPEEMIQEDLELLVTEDLADGEEGLPEETEEVVPSEGEEVTPEIQYIYQSVELNITDYEELYKKLLGIAQEAQKSIVTVTGTTSGVNWFQDTYHEYGESSGLLLNTVVGEGGAVQYLILVDYATIEEAENIAVTFCDGNFATATLRKYDRNTNLAVIAVNALDIVQETRNRLKMATFYSTNNSSNLGNPVLAVGSPLGSAESITYGMVTSTSKEVSKPDNNYMLLTTDIYSSPDASGILLNLEGQVIGIVTNQYNEEGTENLLSALGIAELKSTITKLMNTQDIPYIGLYVSTVPEAVRILQGIPAGAYVTKVEVDSPAMQAGLQAGDVIVRVGEGNIISSTGYINNLSALKVDTTVVLGVKRMTAEGYTDMEVSVVISKME